MAKIIAVEIFIVYAPKGQGKSAVSPIIPAYMDSFGTRRLPQPMTVEMGIRHRDSGEYEVVPVATADTFRRVWLPACERLGLELVPLFAGGALTTVPAELVPRVVAEVQRLRGWAAEEPDGEYLVDRCSGILAAFARTNPAACEYDFG